MRLVRLFLYFLFFILQFKAGIVLADSESSKSNRTGIALNAPITIKTENGNLSLEDTDGKLIIVKHPPFFSIKVEPDWKIYLPLFAALMTFLFSIYLAFINHKYIKNQKWYDKRSDKLLNLIDQINNLVKGSLTDRANYPSYITKFEIDKFKIQMLSFCKKDSEIDKLLDNLMEKINQDNPNQGDTFIIVDQIIKLIVEEVKNG